ncbi:divalent metal cation transporter, partial [bacterium]|nr:divalent metal cation transporter [bacterium]
MSQEQADAPREQTIIESLQDKPMGPKLWGYLKLTGPGWLQSAITLGGGSLASGLFLGVLAGFSMMWLQPFAMVMGIIMLSAIGYVALSTDERPFDAINKHVNPVLGWGWAIATALANIVWCLPQFSLGVAATRQNLFPSLLGPQAMPETTSKIIATAAIFAICFVVIWFYDKGSRGIKIFEGLLKIMVGVIMLCFFGVVAVMTYKGVLDWGAIGRGFIPDLSLLTEPAATFAPALAETGEYLAFWKATIVGMQQDVMISASATAVGINMTFLLPYSMLAKGWGKSFRGFAIFDISTGLFIPFILATSCIVIASASQFHT